MALGSVARTSAPLSSSQRIDVDGGGFADVVGVGFEGQAPDGDAGALDRFAQLVGDFLGEAQLLVVVGGLDGVHKKAFVSGSLADVFEGGHVLGEAASAIAAPGRKKAGPMRTSDPMPLRMSSMSAPKASHRMVISFMNEMRDGEHGVGGVFAQFGRLPIHRHEAFLALDDGVVEPAHDAKRFGAVAADDDPVGKQEILHRRAFAQKLGVGNHLHVRPRLLAQDSCTACGWFPKEPSI